MTRGNTLLLAAIAGLAVVGAGFLYYNNLLANKESAPEKITIGVATWIGFSPLYIAKEKGFFGKVEVDLRRIDDTAVYDSAMLRGDVDGICASMDSFATAIGGGVNGRVVYLFDESAGADGIVSKPSIRSVQDLKGKKIAAQTGWPGQFFLIYVTKQAGISTSEYTMINLDSDKAGVAFMSGDLDAAVTWEPWLSKIKDAGKGIILVSSKSYPGLILDGLEIRPDIISTRPHAVQALVQGALQAVEYWRAHPREGNEIVARTLSLSPDEVGRMIQGVRFLDRKLNQEYLQPNGRATQTLNAAIDIWVAAGQMRRPPPLQNPVIDSFVQ